MSAVIHPNISNYAFNLENFLSSIVGNTGVILLVYGLSIVFISKTKQRITFLTLFSLVFTVLCIGLAIYANIFSTFFTFSQLSCFNNPSQGAFFVFYAKYALSMLVDYTQFGHLIPFIILLIVRVLTDANLERAHSPLFRISMILTSLLFMIVPMSNLNKKLPNTIYSSSLNALYGAEVLGVYDFYFYDFYRYLNRKDVEPTPADQEQVESFLQYYEDETYINPIDNKTYTVGNEYTGLTKDKNLIIIQLEAFNNFLINLKVDGIEITPNLNKLAQSSLYYDRFYSTAGIGNTSDSEFSALTGLYGNGNDLTIFDYSGNNYETLAKDFKKAGYSTLSSHGNVGDFYHRNREHLNTLGFDTHYDLTYYQNLNPNAPMIHSYLDDKYFLEKFIETLPTEEKFFGYGITVTSHSPYVPTPEIPTHDFNGLTNLANSYLDFIMYVDEAIGIFIKQLEKRNLLDDTVLVFFGDHTSSLFRRDLESIYKKRINELDFRLMLQSVPLIIHNPNSLPIYTNHKVSGTTDIYRTMSNLFGLQSKYHFGNDLLTLEPNYIYSPRNLDLIFDDFTIFVPSEEIYGNINVDKKVYLDIFFKYKYHNDLILKTHYFRTN
jgi:phosphoglycerol transferase MdoB-like AlkP superfamily enzyme